MFGLIYNELQKLVKRKRILLAMAFMVFFSAVGIYSVYRNEKTNQRWSSDEGRIENIGMRLNSVRQRLNDPNTADKDKKEYERELEGLEEELKALEQEVSEKKADWRQWLKKEIESGEKAVAEAESQGQEASYYTKLELAEKRYMLEEDIKPLEWYEINVYRALEKVLEFLSIIFIPLVVVLISSDIISSEFQPATIKLLLVRPVNRGKILISKCIAAILSTVAIIAVSQILIFIISGLVFGWSGANYPVTVGHEFRFLQGGVQEMSEVLVEGSAHIIPSWKFALSNCLFIVWANTVISLLAFAVSSIVRNSGISVAFSCMAVVGSFVISKMAGYKSIMKGFFMNYMDLDMLWMGRAAIEAADGRITLQGGIIILALWAVVAFIVSYLSFTKREVMV